MTANAYEIETHEQISNTAAAKTEADSVLKDNLEVSEGLTKVIGGLALSGWLTEGSKREDNLLRLLNHFHNPLAPDLAQAGLLGSVGQSSVLWGQNSSQGFPGWSWKDVRQRYFDALTKTQRMERDVGLSRTFEGLGRQIHLVQDAGSPAHVRNDPHPFYSYEGLVESIRREEAATFDGWASASPDVPGVPDAGWRSLDPNPLAPVAIARLIDSDRYSGGNPGVTATGLIGLAEYTNANFFSEDRIFTENEVDLQRRFPFPNRGSVLEQDFDIRVGNATVKRRYYVKAGGGATGYRLATVGFLGDYHQRFNLDRTRFRESPALDEGVYRDYAARLVPRAVAYSTALIDYFFRGRMAASGDTSSMSIRNVTDETMNGTFALYYDDQNDVRHPVPGAVWTQALAPDAATDDLRFAPPTSPSPKDPGSYMLVFRGALGNEPEAVAGRQVVISSSIVARLIKRKDGTPLRGFGVQAIDVQSGQTISAGVTDEEGKARLTWRPGRTALFIPNVNLFPMYWSGGSAFSSGVEGARVIQSTDVDAQGQVSVVIPVISADWPERIEACTEQPLFTHQPNGFFRHSVLVSENTLDLVDVTYDVNLITFVHRISGAETILCGPDSTSCVDPRTAFVAEDVNRVGQVVGDLVRDMRSLHYRTLTDLDLRAIGDPICLNEYEEIEIVPVTVVER
jgi:hypothetical protein